jgi:plasmid stabilization system protein ParE
MTNKIIIQTEAEADIRDVYYYYEECSNGLGADFLLSLDALFSLIKREPEIFQKIYKNVHRGLIRRFPYGVYYIIDNNIINIIAVMHCKRNPHKWQKRTDK